MCTVQYQLASDQSELIEKLSVDIDYSTVGPIALIGS